MVEIAIVFDHIAAGMTVGVCRACHQVASHDRNLHSQGAKISLEIIIEITVLPDAEFHPVRVPGRAFRRVPGPHGLANGLIKSALYAPHGTFCRVLILAQSAHAVKGPGFTQLFPVSVLFQQEIPKSAGYFRFVGLHVFARVAAHIALDGALLVVDLHGHHGRVVLERQAGIRVHMAEQFLRVFLLQFNQSGVVHGVALHAGIDAARIIQPVALQESAGDDQIDMKINAPGFKLCDQVIKPIQPFRIEQAAGTFFVIQQRGFTAAGPGARGIPDGRVRRMEADHVDAQAGEAFRQLLRRGMVGGVGAGGNIEAQETDAHAVLKI